MEEQKVFDREIRQPDLRSDCSIRDLESFNKVTGEGSWIAGLYFYCMLDHLVDIAHAVAKDFSIQRYHLFNQNAPESSLALLRLYTRMGHDDIFLAQAHRHSIWYSVFGEPLPSSSIDSMGDMAYGNQMSDGYNFPELRNQLLQTASDFVYHAEIGTGGPGLILNFRLALIPFQQYLLSVQGAAIKLYRQQIFPALTEKHVYQVLRDSQVVAVYGVNTPIDARWPYFSFSQANVAIQQISHQLMVKDKYGMYYTQKLESYLETAARRGACAIATAIGIDPDGSSDEAIISLIFKCHAWRTALQFLEKYSMRDDVTNHSADSEGRNGAENVANRSMMST